MAPSKLPTTFRCGSSRAGRGTPLKTECTTHSAAVGVKKPIDSDQRARFPLMQFRQKGS